jgi:isopenicillin N synthase-like dioxygenase
MARLVGVPLAGVTTIGPAATDIRPKRRRPTVTVPPTGTVVQMARPRPRGAAAATGGGRAGRDGQRRATAAGSDGTEVASMVMADDGTVPAVDLTPWTDPVVRAEDSPAAAAARRAVVERLDEVCRTVGFVRISGHGVPETLIADVLATATAFFERPAAEKETYRPASAAVNRGYAPVGSEALAYSLGAEEVIPDLFEAFNIGVEGWPAGDAYYEAEAGRMFAPNIWPAEPARMREVFTAYFAAMTTLAARLMSLFALALAMPPDYFVSRAGRAPDVMRTNHYRREAGAPDPLPGQLRMGAHTDYGACTILLADDVEGLEILGPDGAWHGVRPAPGTFVVNVGDLLAQWTNDRWRSTLHRVVPPPPAERGPARRRSVAFFHEANHDAVVECLPTCVSAGNPARYAPVRAGEHLMAKLLGPRTLAPSTATSTTAGRI